MANKTLWNSLINWLSDTAITPDRLNATVGKDGSDVFGSLGHVGNAIASAAVGGRLTLETGVPVSVADQVAKTAVYFTPYLHEIIGLYDSGDDVWNPFQVSEISVAVPATTVTPFDVFVYDNAGVLTLETLDWTDDTTRATALVKQNGRYVKSGDTSRLYLGTGRTTGVSGQCEDSITSRYLWNYYNRVIKELETDYSSSHTYTTTTWRGWNNNTTIGQARVEFIVGIVEDVIHVDCKPGFSSLTGTNGGVSVGVNAITVRAIQRFTLTAVTGSGITAGFSGSTYPITGLNFANVVQFGNVASVTYSSILMEMTLRG